MPASDCPGRLVPEDHPEAKGQKAIPARSAQLVRKARPEYREQLARPVRKAKKAILAQLARKGCKARRVLRVRPV